MPPMLTWSMAAKYLAVSLPIVGLLWLVLSRRYRGHRAAFGALAIVLYSLLVALLVTAYLDPQARAQTFSDPWPGVIFTAVLTASVYHALPVICCGSTFAVMSVLVVGLLETYRSDAGADSSQENAH
jgi:TRAP-type C4-dicarboxylate transport system permease small subunit